MSYQEAEEDYDRAMAIYTGILEKNPVNGVSHGVCPWAKVVVVASLRRGTFVRFQILGVTSFLCCEVEVRH